MFDHRANDRLHKTERAAQIRVNDRIPILERHSHGQPVTSHASVVNQNVDPAKIVENLGADFLNGFMVRDIDRVAFRCIGADCIDLVCDVLCVCVCAAHAGYTRSLVSQLQGDSLSDPPPCPGYNRNLILKSHTGFRS